MIERVFCTLGERSAVHIKTHADAHMQHKEKHCICDRVIMLSKTPTDACTCTHTHTGIMTIVPSNWRDLNGLGLQHYWWLSLKALWYITSITVYRGRTHIKVQHYGKFYETNTVYPSLRDMCTLSTQNNIISSYS